LVVAGDDLDDVVGSDVHRAPLTPVARGPAGTIKRVLTVSLGLSRNPAPRQRGGAGMRGPSMASKRKEARADVKLVSSASSHCYYVSKNRNNVKDRLQLKKYDPIVRKHVLYKEGK